MKAARKNPKGVEINGESNHENSHKRPADLLSGDDLSFR
jgi:hypothetical protein